MGFLPQDTGLDSVDIVGLQALLPLSDRVLDLLPFEQGAMAFATDGAKVHEYIRTALALNKAIALGIIEPLNGACLALSHYRCLQHAVFIVATT